MAHDLIGARLAVAGILGEDPETLLHFAVNGLPPDERSQLPPPPPRQGLLGSLLEGRGTLRLRAPDHALQSLTFLPSSALPIHSLLGVPIFSPRRLYGWLCLIDKLGAHEFTEEDELLAATLAAEVAVAYENATLYMELQRYTGALEQEVRERQRAQLVAGESAVRLADLSRRLLEVQEDARRHLARELHDEIGQLLTGLKLSLETCLRLPARAMRVPLEQAQALVSELIARVRDMSLQLRPAMLDDFGLLPTLHWYIERYTLQTHVRVTFEHRGLERRFAPEVETVAYRIVQEALTNVARHAAVHEAAVYLGGERETLIVQIQDWGLSLDLGATLATGHTGGLAGMRERARLVGGRLVVESAPGVGTLVRAELPLHPATSRPSYDTGR